MEINIIVIYLLLVVGITLASLMCILLIIRVFDDLECLKFKKQKNDLEYLKQIKQYQEDV
jgi:hypothetical protein